MSTLLMINASARQTGSQSREIADHLRKRWQAANLSGQVIERDLAVGVIPQLDENTVGGFFSPEDQLTVEMRQATALSDTLIEEIQKAETIIICTPMYNFGVPASLKAWIDQIVRVNRTFSFDPGVGFKGLLGGKKVYIVAATGAVFSDPAMMAMDYLSGYLKSIVAFLGMSLEAFWLIEGSSVDADVLNRSKATALEQINGLWSAT